MICCSLPTCVQICQFGHRKTISHYHIDYFPNDNMEPPTRHATYYGSETQSYVSNYGLVNNVVIITTRVSNI